MLGCMYIRMRNFTCVITETHFDAFGFALTASQVLRIGSRFVRIQLCIDCPSRVLRIARRVVRSHALSDSIA